MTTPSTPLRPPVVQKTSTPPPNLPKNPKLPEHLDRLMVERAKSTGRNLLITMTSGRQLQGKPLTAGTYAIALEIAGEETLVFKSAMAFMRMV